MELLDIVDEKGNPTERQCRGRWHTVRESGTVRRTCGFFRRRGGVVQILLQKRSDNKDSDPGCYDISSAGHIPAGSDYIPSAVRELKEELGVDMNGDELIYCGQRRFRFEREFHGSMFRDNQVSNVYALWLDREEEAFVLQEEEVSEVRWMDFADCVSAVRGEPNFPLHLHGRTGTSEKCTASALIRGEAGKTAQYFQRRSSR